MQPHLLPHRRDMFVVERRPGRLGKRAGRLGRNRQGAHEGERGLSDE
jgi:hypothetical protein